MITNQRPPIVRRAMSNTIAIVACAWLLVALCAHGLIAQTIGFGNSRPFSAVVLTTGATTMSVDALNASLTPANYAGLSNDGISYGMSGYYAFGRAILGADFSRTVFGEEGLSNGRTDALDSKQLLATASYAIVATDRISMYPTLGVGLGSFDVSLRDRNGGATASASQPTFAEVAQQPGLESTLSGKHLLFGLGGGADYLVTRSATGMRGVVFGLRAGMQFAPNRTTWTSGGRTVIAGPDASAGGPYLRVAIGFGGR